MKVSLLLICSMFVVSAVVAGRQARQVWAFPEDVEDPRPSTRQPPPRLTTSQPTRQTSTRRTTTTQSTDSGSTTTSAPGTIFQVPNCDCPSPPQYNPVCGSDGNTYVNRQKLECARMCGANVRFDRLGVCKTPRR